MTQSQSLTVTIHTGSLFDGYDTSELNQEATTNLLLEDLEYELGKKFAGVEIQIRRDNSSGSSEVVADGIDESLAYEKFQSVWEKVFSNGTNWV